MLAAFHMCGEIDLDRNDYDSHYGSESGSDDDSEGSNDGEGEGEGESEGEGEGSNDGEGDDDDENNNHGDNNSDSQSDKSIKLHRTYFPVYQFGKDKKEKREIFGYDVSDRVDIGERHIYKDGTARVETNKLDFEDAHELKMKVIDSDDEANERKEKNMWEILNFII